MEKKRFLMLGFFVALVGMGLFTVHAYNSTSKVKKISLFDNETRTINYSRTEKYGQKKFEVYLDDEKGEYIFLNDKLTGFLKNVTIEEEKQEEVKKLMANKTTREGLLKSYNEKAQQVVKKVNDTNSTLNRYDKTNSYYQEGYDEFVYTFTKTIDGYPTNDSITISLDKDGNLSSLNAPRQGLFDKYDNIKINKAEVTNFIEKNMSLDSYSDISNYEVDFEIINLVNDKLVLEIGIELTHKTGAISTTILYYEI